MPDRIRLVVAATGAVFVVGFVVATATPGPLLTFDDLAYLAMGRTIAGGGAAPMPAQPPYGVLYPALLAPGWLAGLEGGAMLTYARVVNAVCGAAIVPVVYALMRRLFPDLGWREAFGSALVAAMLPAGLLTGSIVWTERLLALLIAAALLALVHTRTASTLRPTLSAIAIAVAMYAGHPRLGPAAVVAALVAVASVRGRGWRVVVALTAAVIAGLWLVERARVAVASAAFGDAGTYDAADIASRRGLEEIPQMLQHGMGGATYLVLAGTGLVAWGCVVLARTRPAGWPTLAVGLAVLAVAAWFLTGVPRADKWLHGRYVEVMAPVVVAVGLMHVRRLGWKLALALLVALPALGGIIAAWNGPGDTWASPRSPVMMLGVEVSGAPYGGHFFEPGAAASVAIIVGLGAWVLARRRFEAAVAFLLVASLWGVHSGLGTLDGLFDGATAGQVAQRLDPDEPIEELYVDVDGVSFNLTGAVAFAVGFDDTVTERTAATTHLLLPVGTPPPSGAVLAAEFDLGTLWRMAP